MYADNIQPNKGDAWDRLLDWTDLPECVPPSDVDMSMIATYNDGWNIDFIMTIGYSHDGGNVTIMTADIDVYKWTDADGSDADKQFDLHKPADTTPQPYYYYFDYDFGKHVGNMFLISSLQRLFQKHLCLGFYFFL